MGTIQVTPEQLEGKATEVRGLKSNHDETMQRLANLVRALNEQWKGAAQDAFRAKFEEMQPQFRSFSERLEKYAADMDTAARGLRETDRIIGEGIQSSGSGETMTRFT